MKDKLVKRIKDEIVKLNKKKDKNQIDLYRQFINDQGSLWIKNIITAKPNELMNIYDEIVRKWNCYDDGVKLFTTQGFVNKKKTKDVFYGAEMRESLKRIFDYEDFIKKGNGWNAYSLCEKLDIPICPYCNQQFTFTIIEDSEIMRPELDHFFPKVDYPLFALSLYNLIPCCHGCNSIVKGTRKMNLKTHLHPYIDEDKTFSFKYEIQKLEPTIKTDIKMEYGSNTKVKETCEFFKLDKIYEKHSWLSNQMVQINNDYPKSYIEELLSTIKGIYPNVTFDDVIKMIYASYSVRDENKEILGKLRKDIFMQLVQQYK